MRNRTGPCFVWFIESEKQKLSIAESLSSLVVFQGKLVLGFPDPASRDSLQGWHVSKQGMDTHGGDLVILALPS